MNGAKARKLRKFTERAAPGYPVRHLVVGKSTPKQQAIWLDFKTANRLSEEFAALVVRELLPGSAEVGRRDALADILNQYKTAIEAEYETDADIKDHEPVQVWVTVIKQTAINAPQTQRAIYRKAKAAFAYMGRKIGYEMART